MLHGWFRCCFHSCAMCRRCHLRRLQCGRSIWVRCVVQRRRMQKGRAGQHCGGHTDHPLLKSKWYDPECRRHELEALARKRLWWFGHQMLQEQRAPICHPSCLRNDTWLRGLQSGHECERYWLERRVFEGRFQPEHRNEQQRCYNVLSRVRKETFFPTHDQYRHTHQSMNQDVRDCQRCQATCKGSEAQCRRITCKIADVCWQHLKSNFHLQVKKSRIPNAGLGLFTTKDITVARNRTTRIVQYARNNRFVDVMSKRMIDERYGEGVGVYVWCKSAKKQASSG